MNIPFFKYQGAGNDFVIIDDRMDTHLKLTEDDIRSMCNRHFGIGADGLMVFRTREEFDFKMDYYNADGKLGTMCGNGGRCMVQFAAHTGMVKPKYKFLASDGEHEAEIDESGIVRLKMNDVNKVEQNETGLIIDTGSPHLIKFAENIDTINVQEEGSRIRNSERYQAEGINVNFVEKTSSDSIYVRTYERGVESETLSCGTGITAAALATAHNESGFNHVNIKTRGGTLYVEFDKIGENTFTKIWLCGPANFVFTGIWPLKEDKL